MAGYLVSEIHLDKLEGRRLGIRSHTSDILFFGKLQYKAANRQNSGHYLVLNDGIIEKRFGPLHADDRIEYGI